MKPRSTSGNKPTPTANVALPMRSAQRSSAWVLYLPLIGATFLSKLAIPPFGARGIGITLPILLLALLWGTLKNVFRIAPMRLALFAMVVGLMSAQTVFMGDPFSKTSLLLFLVLHLPFVFYLRTDERDVERVNKAFTAYSVIFAVCAMLQFFLQFGIAAKWVFPIETFVPDNFRIHLYNNQAAMSYGAHLYRANGVFLMEPSFLSQVLAVAIVLELSNRNRWWLQAILATGLLVSYSGTGMIILAFCVPLIVIAKRRWDFLVLALLVILIAMAFGDQLFLDKLLSRTHEFNSYRSSGFARFVGGFYMFDQFMWGDVWRTLFGFGAGSFKDYMTLAHYPVSEMPLFKMVFEFGVVGAAAYFAFLFFCLFSTSAPWPVSLAIAVTFFLNGLYVPFSHSLALSLLIWTSYVGHRQSLQATRQKSQRAEQEFGRNGSLAYRSR